MSSIIDQLIDEELQITQHPNKDMIISAIGNPDFLITFSDVNKVGINPRTKFNTPAGIYGWHFDQATIDGAKRNEIFASGRKYGHLMKIRDGAKVLWLGDDGKTGGVPSIQEVNAAIARKYPAFTQDTFPIYNMPSGPPGSDSPPKQMMAQNKDAAHGFVSPQEWLEDPKHVETLSKVSQREYGGSTESEKLYDYVQAAAKALEIATDKKITLLSNGILRALGYDAVIDAEGKGIIHKAERNQGFFTSTAGLQRVATIINKEYRFRDSTLYKLLREPGVPMDKKAAALKILLSDKPKVAPGADPQFAPEFSSSDIFDALDYMVADQSNPLTPEMIQDIMDWVEKKGDESPLMKDRILEVLFKHPGMSKEMIENALKKEQDPEVYRSILLNPNAPEDFLKKIYFGNLVIPFDGDEVAAVLASPNVPVGLLDTEAAQYAAVEPSDTLGRYRGGDTRRARRAREVLLSPNVTEKIFNKVARLENGELDLNRRLVSDALSGKNVPMSYYRDILDKMYDGTIRDYTADEHIFDMIRSQYTPEEVQMEILKNYEELAGLNNYRLTAMPSLKFALRSRLRPGGKRPSKKYLEAMKEVYNTIVGDKKKFVTDEDSLEKIKELFSKFGVKINESFDLRSYVQQVINEQQDQPFRQLNEISSEVYDYLADAAEDLSKSQLRPLFGDNERVIIPMVSKENEQVKEFYEMIVEPLAAKGIKVDLKNGVATKEIETQRGKQERKTKLGKTIGRELSAATQKWWNKFQADFLGNPEILEAQDAIVITQHPLDVARMSDFSEADIRSCHSEGSDYFTCALADAKRAGAVAYLIDGEDVPYAQEHINDTELFADRDRGVEGITPRARVRLRRFDSIKLAEEGAPLAVLAPETRVYGKKVPGFLSTVSAWARKVQQGHPLFKEKIDLSKFIMRGGSYTDTPTYKMFNALLGKEEYEQDDPRPAKMGEEGDVDYTDTAQIGPMLDAATEAMNEAKYDYLDDENVEFDFEVEWDEWNESPEVVYSIKVMFDYPVYKFIGSPNVGSKEEYSEEEMINALRRQAAMGAVRDVAENTYNDSEHYDHQVDYNWSASVQERRFGSDTRLVVEVVAYIEGVTHDPDNFGYEIADQVKSYFVDYWEDIDNEIETALKEDGWMVQQPYDRIKIDPEDVKKLGSESFENFNVIKDTDKGIRASMSDKLQGYPLGGTRVAYSTIDDREVKLRYPEGPKLIEILREVGEADKFKIESTGTFSMLGLPPERRNNVLKTIRKEIMDAARAAASQPSLPLDLPAGEKRDVEKFLPAVDDVKVGFRQESVSLQPYRRKGEPGYAAQGVIVFTFKPTDTQEQIDTNLKFVKYLDENSEPIQAAIQKEWDDILDEFEKEMPLVKEPPKQESLKSTLQDLINEVITEAKFENEATKMVRDAVKNIKDHLRAYGGEPRIQPRFGVIENPLESIVYDKEHFGGLPEKLADQGITKVTFHMKVEPSTAFGEGIKFGVDGKTISYDDDDPRLKEPVKERQVIVNVYLSDEFRMTDMSELIERMKDTAVHEITHGGQSKEILKKSGQAQLKAFRAGLNSIDALRLYYLDPAETEAYARGVYKRAKMSKVPFTTKLDQNIEELLRYYAHPKMLTKRGTEYTEEEVNDFFKNEYRQSLIDYAKKTLPAAVIETLIKEAMEDEEYEGVEPIDYKGEHSAPMAEDGAPLWNLADKGVYPEDVYGPNGRSWYGTGDALDWNAYDIIRGAYGRRDKQLTIYRAVPKGIRGINRGDWVTIVRQYAKDHGESALNGEYDILKKSVTARDIFTDGNSWLEWGYDPQPRVPYSEREDWERYPGKKKK